MRPFVAWSLTSHQWRTCASVFACVFGFRSLVSVASAVRHLCTPCSETAPSADLTAVAKHERACILHTSRSPL